MNIHTQLICNMNDCMNDVNKTEDFASFYFRVFTEQSYSKCTFFFIDKIIQKARHKSKMMKFTYLLANCLPEDPRRILCS